MEQTLSKDVQEKLDMINWDSLKEKYGISRDSFYTNPHLASQLAYGQMTDLVFAGKKDFSGMLSLRAYLDTSGEKPEMKVKVFTMEKEKSEKNAIYLFRQPITSEAVKKAIFETGEWFGPDGKKMGGHLNANGGRPITLNIDGKRQQFLISLHHPTNRVVGMSLDSVRSYFYDKDNNLPGIGAWLRQNNIAQPTGMHAASGYCLYEAYRFNLNEKDLKEVISRRIELGTAHESTSKTMKPK